MGFVRVHFIPYVRELGFSHLINGDGNQLRQNGPLLQTTLPDKEGLWAIARRNACKINGPSGHTMTTNSGHPLSDGQMVVSLYHADH
jgi:hypothetical protein